MSGKRASVGDFTFAGATPALRTDAPADVRPDVRPGARAYTPADTDAQEHAEETRPRSGPGAYAVAVDRAHVEAERRARERAQRALDAAARAYQAHQLRLAPKLAELLDAAGQAESAGLTLDEVRAVVVLAGLPPEIVNAR